MTPQKLYFNANWICRGRLAVLVTRPPEAVSIAVFGMLKLGVFVTLKASARNCNLLPSVTRNCLKIEKSNDLNRSSRSMFAPELPYENWAGRTNAEVSNH